jgi:hypothetical protein
VSQEKIEIVSVQLKMNFVYAYLKLDPELSICAAFIIIFMQGLPETSKLF